MRGSETKRHNHEICAKAVQEENHIALVETAGHQQWQTSSRGEETNRKVDATNEGPWD